MPIPKPGGKEKQDKFISRCMGNPTMKMEYPDNKKRLAICFSSWKSAKKESEELGLKYKMEDLKNKIKKITKILEQEVSTKSWEAVNKSKLPSSCFLWVEDPKKKGTWHLPYKEGAGGIDPKTGMYRSAGPININAVRAIMAALGGARVKPGAEKFKAPASVVAKATALAKRLKIGKYKEAMFTFVGIPISERFVSLRTAIEGAIRAEFGKDYWVSDFSDSEIVFRKEGESGYEVSTVGEYVYQKIPYKIVKNELKFTGPAEKVNKLTTYEMSTKNIVNLVVMENELKRKC